MFNLILADISRIKRSKAMWIMPLIIVVMVAVLCGLFAGLKYVMELDLSEFLGDSVDSLAMLGTIAGNGYDMTLMNLQSDTLIYVLIVVFLVVSAFDFSSGTVKNLLSIGKSKKVIYTSKLLTSYIWTIIAVIFYTLVSALFGYLFFSSMPTGAEIGKIALIMLKQIPIYISIVSLGHMLVFLTQKTAPSMLIYIGSFILFETVAPIIDLIINGSFKVSWLMPLYQLIELTNMDTKPMGLFAIYISCSIYTAAIALGGYFAFKRSELK